MSDARGRRGAAVAVVLAFAAAAGVAALPAAGRGHATSAGAAADPIEGLWFVHRAYNTQTHRWFATAGGAVLVRPTDKQDWFDGVAFLGGLRFPSETTAGTLFGARCAHPRGEVVWKILHRAGGYIGSYQGFRNEACAREGWPVGWSLGGTGRDPKLYFSVRNTRASGPWWRVELLRDRLDLPDAVVAISSVSNGCGGSGWSGPAQHYLTNTSTFLDSNNPLGKRYVVSFKPACDLHDAGYSGAKVVDAINADRVIDYLEWSRAEVDEKFLDDMRELCRQQIPRTADTALYDCLHRGGKTSFGAESRYNAVRRYGQSSYWQRPDLAGVWVEPERHMTPWTITMQKRDVLATWTTAYGFKGRFRGVLVSRDHDAVVKGYLTLAHGDDIVLGDGQLRIDYVHLDEQLTHFHLGITLQDGSSVAATLEKAD